MNSDQHNNYFKGAYFYCATCCVTQSSEYITSITADSYIDIRYTLIIN